MHTGINGSCVQVPAGTLYDGHQGHDVCPGRIPGDICRLVLDILTEDIERYFSRYKAEYIDNAD